MRNAGLEETQAGIKIAGRNINSLRYADDTTPTAEIEDTGVENKQHSVMEMPSPTCLTRPSSALGR